MATTIQNSVADGTVMNEANFIDGALRRDRPVDRRPAVWPDVRRLEPGALKFEELIEETEAILGLFVLDGLIAVELSARHAGTAWLVGADDLVRPQQTGDIPLIQSACWHVLRPTRVLVLSAGVCERARRNPVLFERLLTSAMRTAQWLLARSLIVSLRGIDDRVLLLFALWGERWGRVTPEGIRLELPVTHGLIAECCGTRRPSVTSALRVLHDKGLVVCAGRGNWLLRPSDSVPDTREMWELATSALGFGLTNGGAAQTGSECSR